MVKSILVPTLLYVGFGLFPLSITYGVEIVKDERLAVVANNLEGQLNLYDEDPEHLWNRLHRALFLRTRKDGTQQIHETDPFLYPRSKFLLEGESHQGAIKVLDEFLAAKMDAHPLKRLMLQRDLWASFDYVAWYPDDWVHHTHHEPAAMELRKRLSSAIAKIALSDAEMTALPDNYTMAVREKAFANRFSSTKLDAPFLPADLFDPAGAWVPCAEVASAYPTHPTTQEHLIAVGGRAAHVVLLNLPGGRAVTERYLRDLTRDNYNQFPSGTAVALLRRALAVGTDNRLHITPITEGLQIRVYHRVGEIQPNQLFQASSPDDQTVFEFSLERSKLFSGEHGLRAVGPDEPAQPFARDDSDPFERPLPRPAESSDDSPLPKLDRQLQVCLGCHQGPGVYSLISVRRALERSTRVTSASGEYVALQAFRNYTLDALLTWTLRAKVNRYDWGLLQGMLEKL